MSKGTRVGVSGSRWLGTDFVAAAVRLAIAVPIVLGASTGAPGVVVAAAQPRSADGAFTTDQGDGISSVIRNDVFVEQGDVVFATNGCGCHRLFLDENCEREW